MPNREENKKIEDMTKEELVRALKMEVVRGRQMMNAINELNHNDMLKRLEFLFKVVELRKEHHAFSDAFSERCEKEIEEMLTINESGNDE